MPDTETGNRGRNRQKIPRIAPEEAARVFAQCEHLLDRSPVFVENLRQAGFARFLAPLHEQILELAAQPDSWGERTRASPDRGTLCRPKRDSSRRCDCGGNRAGLKCCGALFPSRTGTPKTTHRDRISQRSLRFRRTLWAARRSVLSDPFH